MWRHRGDNVKSSDGNFPTPMWLFGQLDEEFSFVLDTCALPENAKCEAYYTPEIDGLAQDWVSEVGQDKSVWCNAPWDKESLLCWVGKALEESRKGITVVMLVPHWRNYAFHQKCIRHGEIRHVLGLVTFKGSCGTARKECDVVVFRPGQDKGFLGPSIRHPNASTGTPPQTKSNTPGSENSARGKSSDDYQCLKDIRLEGTKWLWPGVIPLGELTILEGDSGTNKSSIAILIAALLTLGRKLPGQGGKGRLLASRTEG